VRHERRNRNLQAEAPEGVPHRPSPHTSGIAGAGQRHSFYQVRPRRTRSAHTTSRGAGSLGYALADLQRAVEAEIEDAKTDLSHDLARALGAEFTVGEVNGARTVLALVLGALPCYIPTGRGAS
jgi:hypothetical protein